jgi:beta-lactamase class A
VPPIDERIDALQRRNNTKIGVYAVNLDTSSTLAHLDGESFAMCSTFKGYAAARVLQMVQQGALTLDRQIYVDPKQTALPNSPRTAPNSGGQMTLAELCAAAVQVSDNAAANLVLQTIGARLPSPISRTASATPEHGSTDGRST